MWEVQNFKVTLGNEAGEIVVIEQAPDGRVKCVSARTAQAQRADTPPRKATESKSEAKAPAASTAAKAKERKRVEPKARKRAEPTARTEEAPKARAQAKPRGRTGALKWVPVKDHGYDGYAAASGRGRFKALIAKDSQWALFYERNGTWPEHIGCFRDAEKAKARAQELHDAGWPESEFGPVTAGHVARACPAPHSQREKDEVTTTPKAEENPPERPPEPETEAQSDAERDKRLMEGVARGLKDLLDEDEDD